MNDASEKASFEITDAGLSDGSDVEDTSNSIPSVNRSSSLGKVRKELEDDLVNSENESEREDSTSEENSSALASGRKHVREAAK